MLNERGMALPLTMLIMLVLTSLGLGLLAMAGHEPVISQNLAQATQARFAAEAGIEAAFDTLANTPNWNTLLVNANPGYGVTLFNNHAIGTLAASRGMYSVLLRNDIQAGDSAITGVVADAGGAQEDTNNTVIVTSSGAVNLATRRIRVAARKITFPPKFFPGALALPGKEAQAHFNGDTFGIDGRGYNMDGTPDPGCASVFGIAVSPVLGSPPGSNEGVVEGALSSQQKDNVWGKSQTGGADTFGNPTIAPDSLTPTLVKEFIDQAKGAADIVLASHQPSGLSMSNIGSTCSTDPNGPTCWGHKDSSTGEIFPKTVYIKGDADPTSMFTALGISGTSTGYGILIVEDGDLKIWGNFSWNGAIIVTGSYVGVGFLGGGNQTVYGSVISNETATDPGFYEGVLTGNAKLRYSCTALAATLRNRKLMSIVTWKDLAPDE